MKKIECNKCNGRGYTHIPEINGYTDCPVCNGMGYINVPETPTHKCTCWICERSREFEKHLKNVTDQTSVEFFEKIFNHLYDVEEELEWYRKISKEVK
ncbi:hypothetical protein [uncultured Arcobacter sp.]|uniref:hypothetical protein n=1 Tax=uncultured Arcobacter sp. TaxID=165434 RepID=UPI0026306D0F|nr:hypothetical protein [uncultured Arcobacter sp.]